MTIFDRKIITLLAIFVGIGVTFNYKTFHQDHKAVVRDLSSLVRKKLVNPFANDGGCMVYICPDPGERPVRFRNMHRVAIKLALQDNMCMLTLKIKGENGKANMVPLGRSYDWNSWETVPGPYSIDYNCEGPFCVTSELPNIQGSHVFELISFSNENRQLKSEDIAARFLEQTTFGPTREALSPWKDLKLTSFSDLDESFAEWIHEQIYDVPLTSHRKEFR